VVEDELRLATLLRSNSPLRQDWGFLRMSWFILEQFTGSVLTVSFDRR